MVNRSISRTVAVALCGAGLIVAGAVPAAATPAKSGRPVVLKIKPVVLDINTQTSNLDHSLTDVNGGGEEKFIVAADVVFEFNKATLNSKAHSRLSQVAGTLKKQAKNKTVHIDGYTDSKGSNSYNQKLSERRAAAVDKALKKLVGGANITFTDKGHGEAHPIAPNTKKDGSDNPKGRAQNRRVEISFKK